MSEPFLGQQLMRYQAFTEFFRKTRGFNKSYIRQRWLYKIPGRLTISFGVQNELVHCLQLRDASSNSARIRITRRRVGPRWKAVHGLRKGSISCEADSDTPAVFPSFPQNHPISRLSCKTYPRTIYGRGGSWSTGVKHEHSDGLAGGDTEPVRKRSKGKAVLSSRPLCLNQSRQ